MINNNKNKMITELSEEQLNDLLAYTSPYTEENAENIKKLAFAKINKANSKSKKFKFKPLLVSAIIAVMLITTVVAAAPALLVRIAGVGSIDFFNNDQVRLSGDYEIIKQYSSEVGVTAQGKGFTFTIDNIAFDGTFLSVFYTIEKEKNIVKEIEAFGKKWAPKLGSEQNEFTVDDRAAVSANMIGVKIPEAGLKLYMSVHSSTDGYLASDFELKVMRSFVIAEDLPDIFDIEITHFDILDDGLFRMIKNGLDPDGEKVYDRLFDKGLSVSLTIDSSESRINTLAVSPDINAAVSQDSAYGGSRKVRHDINIDRVSISPLGNIIVFTQIPARNGETSPGHVDGELFNNYYITDDKGNFYRRPSDKSIPANTTYNDGVWQTKFEPETTIREFYGDVPSDAEYLKILPYNIETVFNTSYDGGYVTMRAAYSYVKTDELPKKIDYSQYGSVTIESVIVTEKDLTLTFTTEGIVDMNHLMFEFRHGNTGQISNITYLWHTPLYDYATDSYKVVFTFEEPVKSAKDDIKNIGIMQFNIELLEDQAIIIPLR